MITCSFFLFLELISITVTVTCSNFSGIMIIPVMSILTQFPQQNQPNEARNREHSNFLEMVFLENCCRRAIHFSTKRQAPQELICSLRVHIGRVSAVGVDFEAVPGVWKKTVFKKEPASTARVDLFPSGPYQRSFVCKHTFCPSF